MLPTKYRRTVGQHFDRGLDILLLATGIAVIAGALSSDIRTSAVLLMTTFAVTAVVAGVVWYLVSER